jgi:hypothetical protein
MTWFKRFVIALPIAVAAVLTALSRLANPLHLRLEKVAGYGFLFFYPWAWLLDHDWFGHTHRPWLQSLIAYAIILWIPAMLYSGCLALLFRILEVMNGRIRR